MPTPTLEEQVNDLLKFVFSKPETPGKAALVKALREDWRKVLKQHVKIPASQARQIDAFTREEVALVSRYMGASVRAGKIPRLTVKPTSAKPKPTGPIVDQNGTNNVYC
jgi:hypothetical protein